jgi:hypothetical protein
VRVESRIARYDAGITVNTLIDKCKTEYNGIAFFRLLQLRGAVKLEKVGIKSRGGSVRKLAATECGMKPTTKIDDVIAELESRIMLARVQS